MWKFTKTTASLIIALLVLAFVLIFYFNKKFSSQSRELRIDSSIILVQEINKIAQLFTARYYDEIAIDTFKLQDKKTMTRVWEGLVSPNPLRGRRPEEQFRRVDLVVVARGTILAGYDFSLLEPHHMIIEDKSITLVLPPPQILDVIINPSDYDIFIEEGTWSLEEAVGLKQKAAGIMQQRAIDRGILQHSEQSAIMVLQNFLLGLGFEQVKIETWDEDEMEHLKLSPSLE